MSQKITRVPRLILTAADFHLEYYRNNIGIVEITAQTPDLTGIPVHAIDPWAYSVGDETIMVPISIRYVGKREGERLLSYTFRPRKWVHYERDEQRNGTVKLGSRIHDNKLESELIEYPKAMAKKLAELAYGEEGLLNVQIMLFTHFFPSGRNKIYLTSPSEMLSLPPADDLYNMILKQEQSRPCR